MIKNLNYNEKTISETLARAVINAGVEVVTYVPGFGGNEVFDDYNKISKKPFTISFNEEAAYSVAHGAALTGVRSASFLKSHGLVKAGNSVTDSLYSGTTAGFLTIIFNDSNGKQSDSILDIEAFLKGIGIPYENARKEDIYRQVIQLFDKYEKRSLPYALVVESTDVMLPVITGDWLKLSNSPPKYHRDISQHVLCPFFLDYQYQVLTNKYNQQEWSGIKKPGSPLIPDSLPDKWKPVAASYAGLFSIFKSIRGSLVIGDTGISTLFACEPFNCIDITTYMGGSIPLAVGAYLGGYRDVWAVTGDFSFIAAGHLGLLEALQRRIPLKVLIFYNGKAETTGGQLIPDKMLDTILAGYDKYIRYIHHPENREEVTDILSKAAKSTEISIVIAEYK
jgi:TPP-dependent indolepyruvate ferredoxin oxidoreductase alpha subunit